MVSRHLSFVVCVLVSNTCFQIMKTLRHQNVVHLKHCFFSNNEKDELCVFSVLCACSLLTEKNRYLNLVMEYVPETIYRVVKHYNKTKRPIPMLYIKLYMYQGMLNAHKCNFALESSSLLPPQLLVPSLIFTRWVFAIETSNRRICFLIQMLMLSNYATLAGELSPIMIYPYFFGRCSRFCSAKQLVKGEPNIAYICSRYYRAPELIFGATDYSPAIDVWSFGCVFAEMLLGTPIFPGESNVDQLVEIIKVVGTPTREEIHAMNPNYTDFKFPQIKPHPWAKVFRNRAPPEAIDLVSKLLRYAPLKRLSPLEACAHPFFDELRDPAQRLPSGDPPSLPCRHPLFSSFL